MRSKRSNSRSRTGSIVPVRSPKTKKVTGFYRMVPFKTKDGKRTYVSRFLPRSQWPKNRSVLAKLGVRESLSQIEKNNRSNLRRGRAKRVAKSTRKSARRSSRSPSRSPSRKSTRRSSRKVSRRASRRSSRKATRRASRRSSRRSNSPSERAFRKKYYNVKTAKAVRPSVAYAIPTPVLTPSPSPIPQAPPNPLFGAASQRKERKSLRKSISSGLEKMKQRRSERRSSRSARRAARKQTRHVKAVGASVSRGHHEKKKSHSKSKKGSSVSRGHYEKKSKKGSLSHHKKGASASYGHHEKKKSHSHHKTMKGARVSHGHHEKKKSHSHHKTMKGASVSRGSHSWSDKKNAQLKKLLRRDYGRVLTRQEFMNLPEKVRSELQKQAYERAFKDKADRTPTRLLSEEGKEKRRLKEEKQRKDKSLSRSGRKIRSHQIPYQQSGNGYPGPEQAKRDFIDAYTRKYPERSTRLSVMRKDLNRTEDRLVDPYSPKGYETWKNEPWNYDLRGIDTAESDDSFYDTYKERTRPSVGASVSKRRRKQRKSASHSKKSRHHRNK